MKDGQCGTIMVKVREFSISMGRIWVNQLPKNRQYEPSSFKQGNLPRRPSTTAQHRSVCAKIRIHDTSGILGARFIPARTNSLTIKIGVLEVYDPQRIIQIGLTNTLAQVVLDESMNFASDLEYLGSGTLLFDHATYDNISGGFVYRLLTRSILRLMNPQTDDLSNETISKQIKDIYLSMVKR
jgi:hypothetical protein